MGQKVHPIGFRLGYIKDWQARWYADEKYTELLHEDIAIRKTVLGRLPDAGIPRIEIERGANQVTVTVHTSKPGIVIGKGGAKVDELRTLIEALTEKKVRLNIQEIRVPEMDAFLVARSVADQLERRVSYKRAIKQAVQRTMQRGAGGIKIIASGRLAGAEMSRREVERQGRVPLHTLRADIDYGLAEARTTFGAIGIKVWIYKGDVIAERSGSEADVAAAREMAAREAGTRDKQEQQRTGGNAVDEQSVAALTAALAGPDSGQAAKTDAPSAAATPVEAATAPQADVEKPVKTTATVAAAPKARVPRSTKPVAKKESAAKAVAEPASKPKATTKKKTVAEDKPVAEAKSSTKKGTTAGRTTARAKTPSKKKSPAAEKKASASIDEKRSDD